MIFAQNNIRDFLYTPGKYFLIPEFQRPYTWQADNVRTFLEDVELLAETRKKKHYFGTIVFVNDPKDLNADAIIDGQQRVTTSLLMITAIYHLTLKNPQKSSIAAGELQEKYLFNSSQYINQKQRIRLRSVTTDDIIFKKIYEQQGLDAIETQSRLFQAYRQFYEYFETKDNLERYITALQQFDVVTIELNGNDDDPQRVFESINSTGKPLSDGDKIRNFALMLNSAAERQLVYEKYWQHIEKPLSEVNKDNITDFFRNYIICQRNSIIQLGNVYPEFKKLFATRVSKEQSEIELVGFYGDILKNLDYYLLVKFGIDSHNKFGSILPIVERLRYLQIELYMPFAMHVLRHYDSGKIDYTTVERAFNLVETYYARRIICNIPTTGSEVMFATMHRDIIDHQKTSPDADYISVLSFMLLSRDGRTRLPRDTELQYAVENNPTYYQRKTHVNYILTSIDNGFKEFTLKQIIDKSLRLTIEHIMPQTLSKKWIEELGDNYESIHNRYLHTLANLTLTGYNSEYSNRTFQEKKVLEVKGEKVGLDYSQLKINEPLRTIAVWDEQALKHRQVWWSKKLAKVWPLPQTDYRPVEIDTKISLLDDHNLKGAVVRTLFIFDDTVSVTTWAQALDTIVEHLYDRDPDLFNKMSSDDFLRRQLTSDDTFFSNAVQVYETGYYINTLSDTNTKLRIVHALAKLFELNREDVMVELAAPLNNS